MKRPLLLTLLLILAVILPGTAVAEEPFQAIRPAAPAAISEASLCGAHNSGATQEFLFLRYPGGTSELGGPVHIGVRVTLDGELFLTESLVIEDPSPDADPVVELLARNPEELDLLLREAAGGSDRVRFEITAAGMPKLDLSLDELLAHTSALLGGNLLPQLASSTVELAGGGPLRTLAAQAVYCETCWANYFICQSNNCQAELPPRLCDLCDTILDSCLATCVPKPCPVTTEIVYEYFPLYRNYGLGTDCFYDVFPPFEGQEFKEEMWTWKLIKKQITQHADCTKTTEILEVTYPQDYCYDRLPWECCAFPDTCSNRYPWIRYRYNNCWY